MIIFLLASVKLSERCKSSSTQKNIKEIIQNISRLRGDFERFGESFEVLGSHLQNARSKYDESARKLSGIQEKLERIEVPKTEALKEG